MQTLADLDLPDLPVETPEFAENPHGQRAAPPGSYKQINDTMLQRPRCTCILPESLS